MYVGLRTATCRVERGGAWLTSTSCVRILASCAWRPSDEGTAASVCTVPRLASRDDVGQYPMHRHVPRMRLPDGVHQPVRHHHSASHGSSSDERMYAKLKPASACTRRAMSRICACGFLWRVCCHSGTCGSDPEHESGGAPASQSLDRQGDWGHFCARLDHHGYTLWSAAGALNELRRLGLGHGVVSIPIHVSIGVPAGSWQRQPMPPDSAMWPGDALVHHPYLVWRLYGQVQLEGAEAHGDPGSRATGAAAQGQPARSYSS